MVDHHDYHRDAALFLQSTSFDVCHNYSFGLNHVYALEIFLVLIILEFLVRV